LDAQAVYKPDAQARILQTIAHTMKPTLVVFPHQLWQNHPGLDVADRVILVEDPLFFSQFRFHCQKLILHRASMTEFMNHCQSQGKKVHRVEASELAHSGELGKKLVAMKVKHAVCVEPTDTWLKQRVSQGCADAGVRFEWMTDPSFLTPTEVMQSWLEGRKKLFFTDFYMHQRKRLGILLDANKKPVGGKWTFDTDNRKKLPKGIDVPVLEAPDERPSVAEAKQYVAKKFPSALGTSDAFGYPVTFEESQRWLDRFIRDRLALFGDYEDAISQKETFVFHGVLTPMLNIGLLTPKQIIDAVLEVSDKVPMNSLEGFLRQIIGWREFIRLVYMHAGTKQRNGNTWQVSRPLPRSFYDGTTGIVPFDSSVKRCLKHAYCHHIERLMVLGNFMLLCDIHPDAVYQWFMEMFIDAYDWVMVPNVYGMSQHADGGLMTTKPYISGSSYIRKMSDYGTGPWCEIWDGLYWRFVDRERVFFESNPRMSMMVGQLDKMGSKLDKHRDTADRFLEALN
jgi:deoxyribodipyrimidine photolyase-related protein